MQVQGGEEITKFDINNVKAHFRVTPDIGIPTALRPFVECSGCNYWTVRPPPSLVLDNKLRNCSLTYVVFPKSGHVNVSGLRDFTDCEIAQDRFTHLFSVSVVKSVIADNSTAVGNLPVKQLNLHRVYLVVQRLLTDDIVPCTVSLRPQHFPSALLRPKRESKNRISTVILFGNGKFIIIGAKSIDQMNRTLENLKQIVFDHV